MNGSSAYSNVLLSTAATTTAPAKNASAKNRIEDDASFKQRFDEVREQDSRSSTVVSKSDQKTLDNSHAKTSRSASIAKPERHEPDKSKTQADDKPNAKSDLKSGVKSPHAQDKKSLSADEAAQLASIDSPLANAAADEAGTITIAALAGSLVTASQDTDGANQNSQGSALSGASALVSVGTANAAVATSAPELAPTGSGAADAKADSDISSDEDPQRATPNLKVTTQALPLNGADESSNPNPNPSGGASAKDNASAEPDPLVLIASAQAAGATADQTSEELAPAVKGGSGSPLNSALPSAKPSATSALSAAISAAFDESESSDDLPDGKSLLASVASDKPASPTNPELKDIAANPGKSDFDKMLQTMAKSLADETPASRSGGDFSPTEPASTATTASGIESLARSLESQSPAARSFTVQTAVPVGVGQPQWSQAVGEKVLWLAAQNITTAEIHLHPKDLGPMQVNVSVNQDQANVTFTSHHPAVREVLDQSLGRLRDMFSEQGLNLVNVDVSDKSPQRQQGEGKQQRGQGEPAGGNSEEVVVTSMMIKTPDRLVDHYA